jgi:hypothetical protein
MNPFLYGTALGICKTSARSAKVSRSAKRTSRGGKKLPAPSGNIISQGLKATPYALPALIGANIGAAGLGAGSEPRNMAEAVDIQSGRDVSWPGWAAKNILTLGAYTPYRLAKKHAAREWQVANNMSLTNNPTDPAFYQQKWNPNTMAAPMGPYDPSRVLPSVSPSAYTPGITERMLYE